FPLRMVHLIYSSNPLFLLFHNNMFCYNFQSKSDYHSFPLFLKKRKFIFSSPNHKIECSFLLFFKKMDQETRRKLNELINVQVTKEEYIQLSILNVLDSFVNSSLFYRK